MLEVIVQNHKEAVQAEQLGVDRLELVSAIQEGGLTPSYGTIKQVLASVSIPVQVMIRPHSRHFIYDDTDTAVILDDIAVAQSLGGTGVVFGALHEDKTINEPLLEKVIAAAPEMDITFHRAFDEVPDLLAAYDTLSHYTDHIKRILTSGGERDCLAGIEHLRELVRQAAKPNGPAIMPGTGLSPDNLKTIHAQVGASQYHIGKAARIGNDYANGFDREKIARLKALT